MTHINLYEDEDFLITASDDHFDKVVIFLNPAAGLELKGINTVQKNKLPPVKMLAGLYTSAGISEINFWSKNAHWYQRPTVDACVAVLKKAIAGREQQTVIYGSSMGGFGALHIGRELNATVAAFSPQVTLDEEFNIHPEWQISLDYARHHFGTFKSNIIEGKYSKSPIYIFYDGKHPLDEKHASYLRHHCRQATFFNIPYTGHACTGTINQHYGLKRLIIEILDGTFSPSVFRKELFSSFTIAEKKPFTSKEYFFYLQDIIREPANRLLFLGPQEYQYKKLCSRLLNIVYTINKKNIHDVISCMCDRRAILLHAVNFLPKSNHALARILDNEFTRIEACADFYFNNKFYNKAAFLYQKLYAVQNSNIYLARQLAYSLHRAGHIQDARKTLRHYLEKKGEHPEILSCLGELTLVGGELKLARKYLAASLRLQKTVPACLHYAQTLKKEKGNAEESMLFLEKYQNQFSNSGVFLAWLGRFQIEAGKLTDGQATLTRACSLSPCPAWAAELLQKNAHHLPKQDMRTSCAQLWRQVKATCHQAIKNIPTPANSLILQAEEAMRQRQYLEALQLWKDVQKKFPRHPRGYTGAAEACMELKDFAQAETFCLQGQKSVPPVPVPFILYAECALRQRQYSEALKRWLTVQNEFPKFPRGYTGAAEACMELKDFAQAESFCLQGQKSAPSAAGPLIFYAVCAMRQQQYEKALDRWAVLRKKFPDHIRGYIGAINAYLSLRLPHKAEAICLQGLQQFEKKPYATVAPIFYQYADVLLAKDGNPIQSTKMLLSLYSKYDSICKEESYWNKLSSIFVKLLFFINNQTKDISSFPEVITCIAYLLRENRDQQLTALAWIEQLPYIKKDKFLEAIQLAITNFKIETDFSLLLSPDISINRKKEAILNMFSSGNKNILKALEPNSISLVKDVIEDILNKETWRNFTDESLFSFIRILNFFDQEKVDTLINTALQGYSYTEADIKTPKGLLAFRRNEQKKLLSGKLQHPNKGLNIAICISGQLRGFAQVFPSIMNAFDFHNHNTQLFVHTWKAIGRKFPNPAHAARTFSGNFLSAYLAVFNNQEHLQRCYPNLYTLLTNSSSVTEEHLKNFYKTQHVALEDDALPPFNSFSNAAKMLYKIYKSYQMTVPYHFDLILWIRPDIQLHVPSQLSLKNIYEISCSQKALLSKGGYTRRPGQSYGYSIDEEFIIGASELMRIHANTYDDMQNIFWKKQAYSCPSQFVGHASREFQLFAHGVKIEPLNNISYSHADPEKISIESIYDALKKDTATRTLTEEDNLLLKACEEDMSGNQ